MNIHDCDGTYTSPSYNEKYNFAQKQIDKTHERESKIQRWKNDLVPTIRQQEAEMLRPRTFYQYQHPDRFEY